MDAYVALEVVEDLSAEAARAYLKNYSKNLFSDEECDHVHKFFLNSNTFRLSEQLVVGSSIWEPTLTQGLSKILQWQVRTVFHMFNDSDALSEQISRFRIAIVDALANPH